MVTQYDEIVQDALNSYNDDEYIEISVLKDCCFILAKGTASMSDTYKDMRSWEKKEYSDVDFDVLGATLNDAFAHKKQSIFRPRTDPNGKIVRADPVRTSLNHLTIPEAEDAPSTFAPAETEISSNTTGAERSTTRFSMSRWLRNARDSLKRGCDHSDKSLRGEGDMSTLGDQQEASSLSNRKV